MTVHSSHAAGRAAYTGQTHRSQQAAQSQAVDESEDASGTEEAPTETEFSDSAEDPLTSQEQAMIEENFPEDPELSMRLYGRGQDTKTLNPDSVGRNLDMTG